MHALTLNVRPLNLDEQRDLMTVNRWRATLLFSVVVLVGGSRQCDAATFTATTHISGAAINKTWGGDPNTPVIITLPDSIDRSNSASFDQSTDGSSGTVTVQVADEWHGNVPLANAAARPVAHAGVGKLGVSVFGNASGQTMCCLGNGFFTEQGIAGVDVTATAGWTDVLTLTETDLPIGAPLTFGGDLHLDGNSSAEATNGDANVGLYVMGFGVAAPQVLPTIGAAIAGSFIGGFGQEFNVSPPNSISVTPMILNGIPTPIGYTMTARGHADAHFSDTSSGSAEGDFIADFGQTLTWGGITSVVDPSTGLPLTNWTVTSQSGFDYSKPFPVPEAGGPVSLVLATILLSFCRSFYGRA